MRLQEQQAILKGCKRELKKKRLHWKDKRDMHAILKDIVSDPETGALGLEAEALLLSLGLK